MYCSSCGTQVGPEASFCYKCGAATQKSQSVGSGAAVAPRTDTPAPQSPSAATPPVSTNGPLTGPATPPSPTPPKQSPWKAALELFYAAAVFGTLFLRAFYLNAWNEDQLAYSIGQVLGAALVGAFFVFLYQAISKKRLPPARLISLIATVAFLVVAFRASQERSKVTVSENDFPTIVQEAQGKSPIPDPDSPDRALFREYFRQVIASAGQYKTDREALTTADGYKKLFTADSYSSTEAMQSSIDAITAVLNRDKQQQQTYHRVQADLRSKVATLDWSERDKAKFWKDFDSTNESQERVVAELEAAEQRYVDATVDLYSYAIEHHRDFRVKGDEAVITNEATRQTFNEKIEIVNAAYKDYSSKSATWASSRDQGLQSIGLSMQQFGTSK